MKLKNTSLFHSVGDLSQIIVRGLCPSLLAIASYAIGDVVTFNTPGTTTWTVPASVTSITVEARGAGGAGGSVHSVIGGNVRAGGGAGGNYARTQNIAVTPGQIFNVTVGAGGVAPTSPTSPVFTNRGVVSSQTGGTSSFTSQNLTSVVVQAPGGVGGLNAIATDAASTGPNGNAGGGTQPALDLNTVGTFRFKGGNGGAAFGGGSGTGGGGAGDQANGGNGSNVATLTDEQRRGAGGINGGGTGALAAPLNTNGRTGDSPGGGGSGAARNNTTTNGNFAIGGSGGSGVVAVTFTFDAGTTQFAVTSNDASGTAGEVFDLTIRALDANGNSVNDTLNTVNMSSPTANSLLEFDWNGDGTYGDNNGRLDAGGTKTIKVRNLRAQTVTAVATSGSFTTTAPLSVQTTPGNFAKLQILTVGETAAPGTASGKTGTPTARTTGLEFNVTVIAVDEFWNRVSSEDTIAISSTDSLALLADPTPLSEGQNTYSVNFTTPGNHTITATNTDRPSIVSSITPSIAVSAFPVTWAGDSLANLWDSASNNWLTAATPTTFAHGNAAIFTQAGSVSPAVNIVNNVSPFSISVDSTSDYTFGSTTSGSITGMSGGLTKSGTGSLLLNTGNTFTGPTTVNAGLLLLNHVNALPASSGLLTLNTGILGLGAGNFTRPLGTAADHVNLIGNNSGFAAYGADRVVNFGGASAPITWGTGGTPGFMQNGATIQTTIVLGRTNATHTVDLQNPIALTGTRFFSAANGSAVVDGRLSGAITGNTTFSKAGIGTLEISNSANAWSGITYIDNGILRLGNDNVLPDVLVELKQVDTSAITTMLDLNGFSDTIAGINIGNTPATTAPDATANMSIVNSGANTAAKLTVTGTVTFRARNAQATISANLDSGTGARTFSVGEGADATDLLVSGELTGEAIVKTGTGALALNLPRYFGNTTVTTGLLSIGSPNPNNDASTVNVATGTTLNLNYSGTDTVTSLILGGTTLPDGLYGSSHPSGLITGSGTIRVGTTPIPVDPFLAWAGSEPFDGDANGDGVENGLAWILGAANPNVNAASLLPTTTQTAGTLRMTFSMLPDLSLSGYNLAVEHSSDLGISDLWQSVGVPNQTGGTAPVTFIVTPGSPLNRVEVSITGDQATSGRLFGRLKAEAPANN